MHADTSEQHLLRLTAGVVAAHVSHNEVPAQELPAFIRIIYDALSGLGTPVPAAAAPEPAVPIKKSVFPDYIVCLEDGRHLKMLKRHLITSYGMTPEEYRARWSLPDSYPMVAPNYAATRSNLAKKIGLGRKAAPSPAEIEVTKIPAGVSGKKRGRMKQVAE